MEMEVEMKSLFTSESVTLGHPDKIADLISDALLDEYIKHDENSRTALETTVWENNVHVMGEVKSNAHFNHKEVISSLVRDIGYTDPSLGFSDRSNISLTINEQSEDIAIGVDNNGAGDQGIMFGFAINETPELMPLSLMLSRKLTNTLYEKRTSGVCPYLRPDGKSQVTVEYEGKKIKRIEAVVLSSQSDESLDITKLRKRIMDEIILSSLPLSLIDEKTKFFINPTGRFVIGGPMGDTGLTGRKIIVDTYGGYAHHGGGAFSGKDGTKVDRSASYGARNIAKTLVSSGLVDSAEIQLGYAIGIATPISISIKTTPSLDEEKLISWVQKNWDLSVRGLIKTFSLNTPLFLQATKEGHFGTTLPWERVNEDALHSLLKIF